MHITDVRVGMLGVNPIVGMGATHAVGAALSAKVRKTKQVAASFFGEGAASIGAIHEAMNLAAIWKLPVIFVCENNGYAQSTPVEYAVSVPHISDRAASLQHARRNGRRPGCLGRLGGYSDRGRERASRPRALVNRVHDLPLLWAPPR